MDSSFNHIIFPFNGLLNWCSSPLLCLFLLHWLIVPPYCFQEHLEDKHLRQILLDAEASAFYAKLDSDPPSGQDTAK
jgi:hypothetical protein